MFKNLFKNLYKFNKKTIKKKEFSYGKFLLENPKANKSERRKAIKKFFDSTQNIKQKM